MNNNNFNANELSTISIILNDITSAYETLGRAVRGGSDDAGEIANIIRSEDSNLAAAWKNAIDISQEINEKQMKLHNKIVSELEKYAESTLENESATAEAVAGINSSLESSKEALSNI